MNPWIQTIPETEATGRLKAHYDAGITRSGKVYNIVKIMGLRPEQLRDSMFLYRTFMFGPSGLSRADREMIATVVSRANDCFY